MLMVHRLGSFKLRILQSTAGGPSHRKSRWRTAAILLSGVALPVQAETASVTAAISTTQATPNPAQEEIIVTGQALFRDIRPERDLDEDSIEGYGESTVDGLLGELQLELGEEEQPLIIVNGERMNGLDEIGALPVEVLRNVKVLPRGSAVRAGGRSGQRVISLTLKPTLRTATLTAAPKVATEGDWHSVRGEAILTRLHGSTRANIAFRTRADSSLLESERDIIQPAQRLSNAIPGNVIGYPDLLGEIDPVLSDAAGEIVTVTPIPLNADPTIEDFAANANQPAITDIGEFRSLRPKVRNYDLNGTFGTRIAPWLTSTATIRLSRNNSVSKRGLPPALFILSPDNPASPFSTDVGLAYFGEEPLRFRSRRDNGEGNLTFNARFGRWTGNLNARHSQSRDVTRNERPDQFGAIALADSIDPFASNPADLLAIRTDRSKARSIGNLAVLTMTGPAVTLPAGEVQATGEGRLVWTRLDSESSFSGISTDRNFHRSEQSVRGALDVPLTSVETGFLSEVGDLNVTAEYAHVHFSDAGTLHHHTIGLTWEPRPLLRLRAEIDKTDRPPSIQTLGNPTLVTPNVRVFDPLTGQTVDVVQITGGDPSLDPETTKIRRLSGLLTLIPRLNLQLNGEYTDTDSHNFLSSLPEASGAVMLAFPDRFVRDSNGVLVTADLRPVNFDSHREKRLRYGLSLNTQIGGGRPAARVSSGAPSEDGADDVVEETPAARTEPARRSRPATRLQLTVNHSLVFSDKIEIRPELPSVDLLEGGAIGIAGGRVRHQLDGTAAITSRGLGARLGMSWRGSSTLDARIGGQIEELDFSPLLLINFRAFVDASRLFGANVWTRRTRLSLNIANLLNDRQEVRDTLGDTPLQYQPGYRDPIGRTFELELRKSF